MLIVPIRDPDYLNYLLLDGSRPLTGDKLDFDTHWRLKIDTDDNFLVQHWDGAAWETVFKFVA